MRLKIEMVLDSVGMSSLVLEWSVDATIPLSSFTELL